MKHSTALAFVAAAALGFAFGGCNCNPITGDPDAGDSGVLEDGGACVLQGGDCSSGTPCCGFNACVDGVCTPTCKGEGQACETHGECCFNDCGSAGTCSGPCKSVGETCSSGADCCTQNCGSGGTCEDIPGRTTAPDGGAICKVRGEACGEGGECCSTLCKSGFCAPAYTCAATDDLCGFDSECCSGKCSVNDGSAGFCVIVSGAGAPGCLPDGHPCVADTADPNYEPCCTRVCNDLGSGATVCQPVSGCQVAGNPCSSDLACCGGRPYGTVQCGAGECDNGQACRAPGTICGKPILMDGGDCERNPDGSCFEVANETQCCPGGNDSQASCHLDRSGVPRCFGGVSADCPYGYTGEEPCCIAEGEYCDFRDQCCNGAPCVVGADGGRQCVGASCLTAGTECDPNASACCTGLTCGAVSELTYACQTSSTSDGGTDAGTCKANGDTCTTASDCCSEICSGGTCQAQASCQPEGDTCSADGDCCEGLSCDLPVGGGAGTCVQSGATCPTAGQSCSPTNLCCNEGTELQCLDPNGNTCDGTTQCVCEVIFSKVEASFDDGR